jgi:hypothetical protein
MMARPKLIQPQQAITIIAWRNAGATFPVIAKAVGLSTRTVRNWHYKRLMKLAGVR